MEKERLKFCIERFDHYYDSVNNKSAVFLALSTFIVGGLIAAYPSISDMINCGIAIHALMLAVIGFGLATMITVILAATPFLTTDGDSLHYFGSISSMSQDEFCIKSESEKAEPELADLRSQVYRLSCGLTNKFKRLRLAAQLFTIQFILFIPLILIIVCHID